jgi:uncharacterized SAM-binding protein YcdF (DUF218 family)
VTAQRVRRLWLTAVTLLLFASTAYFSSALWLTWLGSFLVRTDPPAPADVAVVLAGDFRGARIVAAADLVRQGLTPRALVSGPDEVYGMYECEPAIAFAVAHGYPESYFVGAPNHARSTREEIGALLPVLHQMGVHRVDLVTSNFHTRRAGKLFRSLAPDLQTYVVGAGDLYFQPDTWWRTREGRKTFLMEALKTVATWFGI